MGQIMHSLADNRLSTGPRVRTVGQVAGSTLWRHRDFLLLWSGQSVSQLGSGITTVALPLTAVVWLHASTFQVGLLASATTVPFLVIALPAGLVVDRLAKRPTMIGCDVARMIIIGSLPVAYALGALTLAQLYVAALVAGLASVFFDVAGQSYVPYLVGTERLVDANGKSTATQSVAQVAGPGLGGALFGLLNAGAMTADALSFGVSWLTLLSIRGKEPRPRPSVAEVGCQRGGTATRSRLRAELLAGLAFVVRHPVLRKIAACNGSASLFGQMAFALDIVFLVRVLHVPAGYTGALIAPAGVGGVLGGMSSGALGRRIGTGRLIWVSPLCFGAVSMLMPLAGQGWRLAMFPLAMFGFGFSAALYNVTQVSYRQSICPPELLGRMNAAMRWISWGPLPLAGVVGGALGAVIGVRPTLWIGLAGLWAAGFWVFASPLRTMRDIPSQADSALVAQGADQPGTT